jgi:hypothetical protein
MDAKPETACGAFHSDAPIQAGMPVMIAVVVASARAALRRLFGRFRGHPARDQARAIQPCLLDKCTRTGMSRTSPTMECTA